jgi:hypothetical protein
MLFKASVLEGIEAGTITLAFRRWIRPTVKVGGTLRTAAGVLAIEAVDRVEDATEAEARRAGFADRAALMRDLDAQRDAPLHRIAFRLAGADPRAALRDSTGLTAEEQGRLLRALARMDGDAPWTTATLRLVRDREGVAARVLAMTLGVDRDLLKPRIRRLKELGLTESLAIGYRLSPRGRALLDGM